MSDLYKKTFRGYLIDHHSPEPPIVTLDKLDIEEYERFFKEANIDNLMLYCKDHWGFTYYDTKIGKRHSGLKEDWIMKLKPVLQKLGIEFNAYYCLEYDNFAPEIHPDWSILKPDGTPLRLTGRIPKWGMPCYETGYRFYVMEQLKEIVSGYHPDSLFLDIFGKSLCYCPICRDKFQSQYGYPLPEEEQELKYACKDVTGFLDDCAKSMLQDILDTVKAIDSKLKVTINFAALYNKEIRDMLDYQFTEPWAGNWLSAAYARDTAPGQYPQLGPGDVSEVYNYQPESKYILAAAQIASQGCRVFIYSGSQHPDGTLEHEEANRVGAAYREVQKFEQYLPHCKVIADIGIIQSDIASKVKASKSVVVNAIGRVRQGSEHRDALLGAMKLCDYCKYTWNVVPEQELSIERVREYQMLLLPSVYYISEELWKVLKEYVCSGGTIIADRETGMYDNQGQKLNDYRLSELYGCNYMDTVDKYASSAWGSYLVLVKDEVWKYMPETFPPTGELHHRLKASSARTLACFVDPTTEVTEDKWVNWWCPPPAYRTDDPAVLENKVGKGKVLLTAFDLFAMENKGFNHVKSMFCGMIEKLVPAPVIRLETSCPEIAGYVCYDRLGQKELIVHEVSHMAELAKGDTAMIPGGELRILDGWKNIKSAELVYPCENVLKIEKEEGWLRIKLPSLAIHHIVRLRYD